MKSCGNCITKMAKAKKTTKKSNPLAVKLPKDEKAAKALTFFVQAVLFVVTAAGVFAFMYLLGVLVF